MPRQASDIAVDPYLRMLMLGAKGAGKSCVAITTSPGPVYVINCDSENSLTPASRRSKNFEWDLVRSPQEMENAITTAREGVKSKKYKTVVLDTLSGFSLHYERIISAKVEAGEGHGMTLWNQFAMRLVSVVDRLYSLQAHVIVVCHYVDLGHNDEAEAGGKLPKSGPGIVPLIAGKAKKLIPINVDDMVFLEVRGSERILLTGSQGVWEPNCRSLEGISKCPADIGEFLKLKQATTKITIGGKK